MTFEITPANWKLALELIADQHAQIEALKSELLRAGVLKQAEFDAVLAKEREQATAKFGPALDLLSALEYYRKRE